MLSEMYYKNKFLTEAECDLFKNYMIANYTDSYRPMAGYPPNAVVNFDYRLSKILPFNPKEPSLNDAIKKVVDTVKYANENIFLFDVDFEHFNNPKNKTAWITHYDGADKAHWAKHQSVNWISNYMQSKLIASVVLSDTKEYEGGDLVFAFGSTKDFPSPNESRGKGLLYIYPAFRYMQINPVLSGHKYHLDFMFSGPYWR